jgi:hypothetical protein
MLYANGLPLLRSVIISYPLPYGHVTPLRCASLRSFPTAQERDDHLYMGYGGDIFFSLVLFFKEKWNDSVYTPSSPSASH